MASTELCKHSRLSLNGLRLQVKLGCHREERQIPQFVRFDVQICFKSPPAGCISDQLEDTVCYARLSELTRNVCNKSEYHLIEKLGWDVYSALKESLPQSTQ